MDGMGWDLMGKWWDLNGIFIGWYGKSMGRICQGSDGIGKLAAEHWDMNEYDGNVMGIMKLNYITEGIQVSYSWFNISLNHGNINNVRERQANSMGIYESILGTNEEISKWNGIYRKPWFYLNAGLKPAKSPWRMTWLMVPWFWLTNMDLPDCFWSFILLI